MKLEHYWYQDHLHPLLLPLLPFSYLFSLASRSRRLFYRWGIKKSQQFNLPIIIIGNITVGGTGKTPFVLWLADLLKTQGKKPGIALRGIGGQKQHQALLVKAQDNPFEVGDEAVLLAQNSACPVAVCIDRTLAVKKLIETCCDIILCDDGLQHYRLDRSFEIAIVDGQRYFGNGHLLPTGPLREPLARLNDLDFIIVNANKHTQQHPALKNQTYFHMQLQPQAFISLDKTAQIANLAHFAGKSVHAIAGIGNPSRFFDQLRDLGIHIIPHVFPDHHGYQISDLDFSDKHPILMTEKDAVKCRILPLDQELRKRLWFMQVKTEVEPGLEKLFLTKMRDHYLPQSEKQR